MNAERWLSIGQRNALKYSAAVIGMGQISRCTPMPYSAQAAINFPELPKSLLVRADGKLQITEMADMRAPKQKFTLLNNL